MIDLVIYLVHNVDMPQVICKYYNLAVSSPEKLTYYPRETLMTPITENAQIE